MSDVARLQRPDAAAIDAVDVGEQQAPADALQDPAAARGRAGGELKYRASGGAGGVAPMQRIMDERRAVGAHLATRVQRKASGDKGGGGVEIPEGGGAQLPGAVRQRFEGRLGADLSDVRVHTGGGSAQAATGLGARAFTVGSDVHFNAGEFAPGSKEGDRLLAHELTHVVQGKNAGIRRKAAPEAGHEEVSHPDEPAEKEADAVADNVADSLHDDKKAGKDDKKAPGLGAEAHAHGDGGAFGGGAFGGGGGEHVQAHEAAHVAQQGPGARPAPISAKYGGVGRKIYRNPQQPGANAQAAAAAASAAPAANSGPPAPLTAQTPDQTLVSAEFKTFQQRYNSLMASLQMPADNAAAQKIWLDMINVLQRTDAAYKAAPTAPNSPRKDMTADAFKAIMKEFEPITSAMAPMMERATKGKKIWAFWSGNCACDIAKANAEVTLEKSALGGLFDQININGNWDIQMWASLSKAYAAHAAKDAEQKTYRGFVGKGASQEHSIFNKVEQPQFMGMLDQKVAANLKITWYACAADPKDAKLRTPDPSCNVGGMSGVMGSGDRASMVQMAETVNDKRAQVYAKTGKVVSPAEVDAALAEAEKAPGAGSSSAAPSAAGAAPPPSGGKPPTNGASSSATVSGSSTTAPAGNSPNKT